MFESFQPPASEPTKGWYPSALFGCYAVLGISGVLISFFKHGSSARLGFFSYSATFLLALYFFITERRGQLTLRGANARGMVLVMLANLPMYVHMFLA